MKKDIFIFYLFSFLLGAYLANGTSVLFEQELGFSFSQIFLLGAFYMLMFVLLEIPSGALADLLGRKKVLAAGCLTLALGALATGLSSTFTQVFLSFILWAVGFSMISGADEALLYDRIAENTLYNKFFGRSRSFWLLGTAAAGVVGPYLFSLNFRYAFLFSAIPFALAGVVILLFAETKRDGQFTLRRQIRQIREGLSLAWQNQYILWAIGVLSLSFGIYYTFTNSYQPYLREIGFSLRAFSLILPVMFLVEGFGGFVSGTIKAKLSEFKVFAATLLLIAGSIAALGLWAVKPALLVLLLYAFLQGVLRPVISAYSNRCVGPSHRATVISVQSMVSTLTAALLLFLFGFLTDRVGLNNLLIILGGLSFIISLVLLMLRPAGNEPVAEIEIAPHPFSKGEGPTQ